MGTSTDQLSAEELRGQLDEQRSDLGHDLEAIGDRVSPKRMTERRAAAVRRRMRSVGESIMGAKDSVTDSAGSATDSLRHAPDVVRDRAQGNPLAAGLVAFGAGVLAASVVPATRKEKQVVEDQVQPRLDDAAEQLGSAAQETIDAVTPAVHDAATEVKEQARQAVAEVKARAQHAAGDVAGDAGDHVREARGG